MLVCTLTVVVSAMTLSQLLVDVWIEWESTGRGAAQRAVVLDVLRGLPMDLDATGNTARTDHAFQDFLATLAAPDPTEVGTRAEPVPAGRPGSRRCPQTVGQPDGLHSLTSRLRCG